MIALADDEYLVAGNGLIVTFAPATPGDPIAGIERIDEGRVENGRFVVTRRLNGDETHQGRQLRLPMGTFTLKCSAASDISIYSKAVSPSATGSSGRTPFTSKVLRMAPATARASGGGTEFPICLAPCHFVALNRNQSGYPCSRAISRTVMHRGYA